MPPKVKITKEEIIEAATDAVRKHGVDAINARALAGALQCSTQPIFSNFSNMDELKGAVIERAYAIYQSYSMRERESGEYPAYKASGMAYIRFAKEERELFKLLFMRDRRGERIEESADETAEIYGMVKSSAGLSLGEARLFHLEMWALVHGIATMIATNYLELEWELISGMLTDIFQGLKKRYTDK